MSAATPILRLVRDADDPLLRIDDPIDTHTQIRALQNEVATLNAELQAVRHEGETRNVHMTRIDEELRLAARLQQDFLPKTLPRVGKVRFHTLFRPAGYVSGDFYDVMRLDENHVGFYLADAVGHGVPAALLTMFIKHAVVTKQISPGGYRLLTASETMARLNQRLVEQELSAASFATAIYGLINTTTLEVSFARGGHPHPILLRENGGIETLGSNGGLLGIFPDETFDDRTVAMQPGDKLILFTDGIEVLFANDLKNDQQQWRDELNSCRHLPGEQIVKEFGQLIDNECGGRRPKDDLTMLVVEAQ